MMPFWVLEIPSPEAIYVKAARGVLPFVKNKGSLQLPAQSAVGIPPVTPGTEMDSARTQLNGILH